MGEKKGEKTEPEIPEDLQLGAGQLWEEFADDDEGRGVPLLGEGQTAQMIVPKKGKLFNDDGVGRVAIIRPCVSRGKRIRGLPPIYTPGMLAEHAAVFAGWPMYLDHAMRQALEEMAEELRGEHDELVEWLEERARSVTELGGRILDNYQGRAGSFWDPAVTFEDDEEFGYQKGAVVGNYKPRRHVREMLEDDPGLLHVSINAYPSGAKAGTAPWSPTTRGILIEGIRRKPRGSVDWVFRGGAGGRPLLTESDDRERAVSLLESVYDAARRPERPRRNRNQMPPKKQISEMDRDELREHLEEENPDLAEAIFSKPDEGADRGGNGGPAPLSEEALTRAIEQATAPLREEVEELKETTENFDSRVEERAGELLEEREESRVLEEAARTKIREAVRNGLPEVWGAELDKRYALLPSGPSAGLQVAESDLTLREDDGSEKTVTAKELVESRVERDVRHIVNLIRESGGRAVVRGLGPTEKDPGGEGGEGKVTESSTGDSDNAFVHFLRESGDLEGDPEKDAKALKEVLEEARA